MMTDIDYFGNIKVKAEWGQISETMSGYSPVIIPIDKEGEEMEGIQLSPDKARGLARWLLDKVGDPERQPFKYKVKYNNGEKEYTNADDFVKGEVRRILDIYDSLMKAHNIDCNIQGEMIDKILENIHYE